MNKKLRALYIEPDFLNESLKRKIIYKNYFVGQDGFFEEALFYAFDVNSFNLDTFYKKQIWNKNDFDVFVYNYKATGKNKLAKRNQIIINTASRIKNKPKILFLGGARAEDIPDKKVLDVFDIIFKREPFKDLGKYNISEENKKKFYPTMLACLIIIKPRNIFAKMVGNFLKFPFPQYNNDKKYDIFFSGAMPQRHNKRLEAWQYLTEQDFNVYGGLQETSKNAPVSEKLSFPKLNRKDYIKAIRNAKINLALDGIGQFTFRHLEIWHLGEFMISSPSIKEVSLLLPAKENIHYVSYNSIDDLSEKIKFYLKNDSAREKIAKNGKEMFDKYYDPQQHGLEIKRTIEKIL